MQPGTANSAMVAKLEHSGYFLINRSQLCPFPFSLPSKIKQFAPQYNTKENEETRQPKQEKQNKTQENHTQVSHGTRGSFSAAITCSQAGSSSRTHRDVLCNVYIGSKWRFFQEELTSWFESYRFIFFLMDC